MNFNPMDLILIKERLYDVNSIPYKNVSNFISSLIDLQTEQYHLLPKGIKNTLSVRFFKKQEMIEFAYQIAKLNVFGDDKKKTNEVKIQCPECGGMLEPEEKGIKGIFFCTSCRLVFTEAEIRERCGL